MEHNHEFEGGHEHRLYSLLIYRQAAGRRRDPSGALFFTDFFGRKTGVFCRKYGEDSTKPTNFFEKFYKKQRKTP